MIIYAYNPIPIAVTLQVALVPDVSRVIFAVPALLAVDPNVMVAFPVTFDPFAVEYVVDGVAENGTAQFPIGIFSDI